MSFQFKSFAIGFVCCAMLGATTAYAAVGSAKIDVFFKDLKYLFNGVPQAPEPGKQGFVYKGTTYVPIRFVGEAMGKEVDWDEWTETIRISDDPGEFTMEDLSIKDALTGIVISLGMSREEVDNKLSVEPEVDFRGLYDYDGLQICYRDNKVVGLIVSASDNVTNRYRTNREIGIGSSKSLVYEQYGNARGDENADSSTYFFLNENGSLKKVQSMELWKTEGTHYSLGVNYFDNTNRTVSLLVMGDHIFHYSTQ